ncbi:hypothetical protein K7G98_40780, partial [Saccharothrix sp. MB29]|nr:hypothetical protein [Saccharothrix sp. MB29]
MASSDRSEWLTALAKHARQLPRASMPKPYFSQRGRARVAPRPIGLSGTARRIRDMVSDLDGRGYLAQALGQDCVDDGQQLG